jgi:VWFA-related protein
VRRTSRTIALAGAIAAALICWAQDPVFRSAVSLVRVDAQVTDGIAAIGGLTKDDFVVKDDGQPQPVIYCSQDEQPLDLLLLFDISDSMQRGIRRLAASAHTALSELRAGDRVAVADFNTETSLIAPFNSNLEEVEETVGQVVDLRFGGGTRILSAVNDSARYLMKNGDPHRIRAILIFTDDDGQPSMKEKTVVNSLWEADAVLCGLIVPSPGSLRKGENLALSENILGAAAKTGGEVVDANAAGHPFREMLHRIRKRYSLYYAMPAGKPGSARTVAVDLNVGARQRYPNGLVLARKGYLMPKATPVSQ